MSEAHEAGRSPVSVWIAFEVLAMAGDSTNEVEFALSHRILGPSTEPAALDFSEFCAAAFGCPASRRRRLRRYRMQHRTARVMSQDDDQPGEHDNPLRHEIDTENRCECKRGVPIFSVEVEQRENVPWGEWQLPAQCIVQFERISGWLSQLLNKEYTRSGTREDRPREEATCS